MARSPDPVTKRIVLFFGGYERGSADLQFRRLVRESRRFDATWSVRTTHRAPAFDETAQALVWEIETEAKNWRVETQFHYCAWNDLIAEDFARPDWRSGPAGLLALADFVVTGAAFRYFRVAWRYGLFFAYALVLVAAFAGLALLATGLVDFGLAATLGASLPWPAFALLAVAVFWLLLKWPGRLLHIPYMLNDWHFARMIARDRHAAYRDRIETFSRLLSGLMRDRSADEIVIVGHSLGAVLAVETASGALDRLKGTAGDGPPVTLMSVGSSLLKVGLHPAATRLHRAIGRVLSTRGPAGDIAWIDYTALVDLLNFYKADPVRVLRLAAPRGPVLRTVKIRAMLGEQAYRRFRTNYLRLHRQFVMGNEARTHYDFFMACCGPMPQSRRIESQWSAVEDFQPDGTYIPADGGPA